jgi:hypothetical protein
VATTQSDLGDAFKCQIRSRSVTPLRSSLMSLETTLISTTAVAIDNGPYDIERIDAAQHGPAAHRGELRKAEWAEPEGRRM